jgi:CelD/BcsL family acetyltransferase involved in cellulose biosynthesis
VAADGILGSADAAVAGKPAVRTGEIALSVYSDLGEVEAVWRAFEASAERTVFQSFDWPAAWQRTIGAASGTTPAIVVGRDPASGAVRLIFPFAIARGRFLRRLKFLASELNDYNAALLASEFAARLDRDTFRRLWKAILRRLATDPRLAFDLCDLEKMPELIAGRPNPFLTLPVRVNPSRAYVASLGEDWEAYYAAKRSAATRKTERKQFKRLAEQGEVVFVDPATPAERLATIETLIGQKRRALARMGADDIFDLPGRIAFYREIASNPKLTDLVNVTRLNVGGEMGAASVALVDRGSYALVLSSYNDGPISQYGPGRAHLHSLMKRAIDRGFAVFDFTIGDEPYKRDWCDREVTLYDYRAAARLRAVPIALALSFAGRAKRMVKQTPALWQAYTRLRARLR